MALEQDISRLVEASNRLTSAIDGKVRDYDRKIEKATNEISTKIRKEMYKVFYVDNVNGNDANSGFTIEQPKKTIKSACDSIPAGGLCKIRLINNYNITREEQVSAFCKFIQIISYPAEKNYTIRSTYFIPEKHPNNYELSGFYVRYYGGYELYNVNLEFPAMPQIHNGFHFNNHASLFKSNHDGDRANSMYLTLCRVNIIVSDPNFSKFSLIGNTSGHTTLALGTVQAPKQWLDRKKLYYGQADSTHSTNKININELRSIQNIE